MKVVIAGGTGFLGRALAQACLRDGDEVVVLSRSASPPPGAPAGARHVRWTPDGTPGDWARALEDAVVVFNLAGEPIAARRWSAAQKARIRDSRIRATRSIVAALAGLASPPVLVNASAVGYYGSRGDEVLTESAAPGTDFLARVCIEWEREAMGAERAGARVVLLRTGLVLAREGGALPPLLLPFRLFVGGPLGSGRQYWPWIHRDDWVALARFLARTPAASGPFNLTAPAPATNRELSAALGRVLRRPSALPTPAFALRILLGEMADALLLASQRARPERALAMGFRFTYTELEPALRAALGG